MILVFGHLDPEDIVSSLSVSKLWNAFHINFNWKNAFTATFGELSSSVDLSQKFNWRQMFFDRKRFAVLCQRKVYKPKLLLPSQSPVEIISLTRDHVVYKIVGCSKAEFNTFDLQTFKKNSYAKEKVIPQVFALNSLSSNYTGPVYGSGQGIICIAGIHKPEQSETELQIKCFWNIKKSTKSLPCAISSHLKALYGNISGLFMNSKYILHSLYPHHYLLDLSKSCSHLRNFEKHGKSYELQQVPEHCVGESCAIVDYSSDRYYYPFLSEADPDLHVALTINTDYQCELILWRIRGEKTVISIAKVVDAWINHTKIVSEHVTKTARKKIAHHWLSLHLNNQLYFVDLKDTSKKIKMSIVPHKWIPNEDKVALTKQDTLIVFDLDRASWASKIVLKNQIVDVSVLDTGHLIAVLGLKGIVTICHWKTAASKIIDLHHGKSIVLLAEDLLLVQSTDQIYYVQL